MQRYFRIFIFILFTIMPLLARDCSLEGRQTAEDIVKDMPAAPKEEKLQECTARGEFFESRIRSCDPGSFEKGCQARIKELAGEGGGQ